jgi:hypothetical protein
MKHERASLNILIREGDSDEFILRNNSKDKDSSSSRANYGKERKRSITKKYISLIVFYSILLSYSSFRKSSAVALRD